MDTDIYICSKPLQYFNVRNIGYGNASSKKGSNYFRTF